LNAVTFPQLVLLGQALWAMQGGASPEDVETRETVLWFRPAGVGSAINARSLLDAVSVYTRDLRLKVTTVGDVPLPEGDAETARAVALLNARGARIGFWCEERGAERVVDLTTVDRAGHVEARVIETTGADEPEVYRAIALKLRAEVVAALRPPPKPAEPAVATPQRPAGAEPPSPPPSAPPPSPVREAVTRRSTSPGPRATSRLFTAAGYRLSAPVDGSPVRHALSVDGLAAIGTRFEVGLGTELAVRTQQTAGGDTVSIFGLPIRAAFHVVRRDAMLTLGAGPFAALHLLWIDATRADGGTGTSFGVAGGTGVDLFARYRLAGEVAGTLALFGEVALPTTRYLVDGTPVLELGTTLGVGLGLVFPAP
jgi:hypothetical protein